VPITHPSQSAREAIGWKPSLYRLRKNAVDLGKGTDLSVPSKTVSIRSAFASEVGLLFANRSNYLRR
jgi:hypothetical protein